MQSTPLPKTDLHVYGPNANSMTPTSAGAAIPATGYAAQKQALSPNNQGYEQGADALRVAQAAPAGAAPANTIPAQYAGRSDAWRTGYRDGMGQAAGGLRNIEQDAATGDALAFASRETGISVDDLTAMAIIESTGNRNVGTNAFGYTGLMQMGSAAATDVGATYESLQGGENVQNNALAGAQYWQLNDRRLNANIPRDPLHMYLAHQQGAGGTNSLMRGLAASPNTLANRNQRNNLPGSLRRTLGRPITRQDFYDYWSGKMTAIQDAIAARRAETAVT
jgi:hypothetical protein